ncbi:hypothetical protein HNQ60_004938 [Povalibacter uvarum]|uniref:Uncharacterized protein n=1 Tax=Povalibacter uvarum TaxID=732238 RepID=A0A841HS02_9GAMM|nr:hypothetical protein [Povalibacter uvarum]MBB6096047.1 hypothetical protein [Povalibacter uvarum]
MAPAFTRLLLAVLSTAGLVACADAGYERLSGALCDDLPPSLRNAGTPSQDQSQARDVAEGPGTSVGAPSVQPPTEPLETLDMAPAVFVIDEFVTSAGQTTSF